MHVLWEPCCVLPCCRARDPMFWELEFQDGHPETPEWAASAIEQSCRTTDLGRNSLEPTRGDLQRPASRSTVRQVTLDCWTTLKLAYYAQRAPLRLSSDTI